jgi:predicted dienelactone hydrolase
MLRSWMLVLVALGASAPAARAETPRAVVGTVVRSIVPDGAYNWRGAKTHALVTQIWYPADAGAIETPQWIGPPAHPLFSAGKAARNAALAPAPAQLPLVLLSHGTGGSAAMMAWLGTALAAHGYLAVAVNHPGNNGLEDYTAQGFLSWWERARDLSTVLDKVLADPMFAARVDRRRIAAAGFSLGGYTMIEIAGGITDRAALRGFCRSPRADGMCKPPPEFDTGLFSGDADDELAKRDPDFAASLRRAGDSYRDTRVRAVFAIAPALGPAFPVAGLRKVAIPVGIVAGSADHQVPPASSASYFAANIPHARLTLLPGVDHYVFLGECTDAGKQARAGLCSDGPGVDRAAVHARAIELALEFFATNLR